MLLAVILHSFEDLDYKLWFILFLSDSPAFASASFFLNLQILLKVKAENHQNLKKSIEYDEVHIELILAALIFIL